MARDMAEEISLHAVKKERKRDKKILETRALRDLSKTCPNNHFLQPSPTSS